MDRPTRVARPQTAEQARSAAGVPPVHLPPPPRHPLAPPPLPRDTLDQAARQERYGLAMSRAEGEMWALEHFQEWLTQRIRRTSRRKAAQLSGVHYTSISRLVSGQREPTLKTALRLIRALGVSPRQR